MTDKAISHQITRRGPTIWQIAMGSHTSRQRHAVPKQPRIWPDLRLRGRPINELSCDFIGDR